MLVRRRSSLAHVLDRVLDRVLACVPAGPAEGSVQLVAEREIYLGLGGRSRGHEDPLLFAGAAGPELRAFVDSGRKGR